MTQHPTYPAGADPENQWQAARAASNPPAPPPAHPSAPPAHLGTPQAAGVGEGKSGGRPGNLMLAGAGSLLAVLAFLGGMAVGHSWDGTPTQQNQFGPGGGRQFPGQGNGQGGAGQGTVPGQQGQGTQPGTGTQPGSGSSGGQTQTS